jgi:hypothetical protein
MNKWASRILSGGKYFPKVYEFSCPTSGCEHRVRNATTTENHNPTTALLLRRLKQTTKTKNKQTQEKKRKKENERKNQY